MGVINNYKGLRCPTCYSKFTTRKKTSLYCSKCKIEYPSFNGSFPILIKDSKKYLVKYVYKIEDEINRLNNLLQTYNEKQITEIISSDIEQLESVKTKIIKFITIEDVFKYKQKTQELGYFNYKEYLIRDWSNTIDSEKELQDIITPLKQEIGKYNLEGKIALIPGCGLGRISYELSDIFKQIYSFDISLTMINMLNEVKFNKKKLKTYSTKNTLSEKHKYKEFSIDIKNILSKQKQKNINRIIDFVGDSKNIPLPSNSVDTIISVYFSDVIPMSEYLEEFTRVLKPNGVLIHFGPLDYHFNDISQHYSLEVFFKNLKNKGFKVNENYKLVQTINSNNSLNIRGYHNILFSAIKKKEPVIDTNTKLYFDKPFDFTVKGIFNRDFIEDKKNSSVLFQDGSEYSNTETVFKILTIYKEGYNIKQIVEKLKKEFNLKGKVQEKAIIDLIHNLITKKVFKI